MTTFFGGNLAVIGCFFLAALSAPAATITIDFGTGAGVSSAWPGTSGASNSATGVALPFPLSLDGGALQITTTPGNSLFCDVGATAGTCGTATGLTTSTAYGLGVGNGRVDAGEFIRLTVNSGFTATLDSFSLTGFGSDTVTEQATYRINGGGVTMLTAPGTNVPLDTFTVNQAFNNVAFGASAGNYSLASLTLDVVSTTTLPTTTPEPATLGLAGMALLGVGLAGRRKRA
jgi:hypothetical protein